MYSVYKISSQEAMKILNLAVEESNLLQRPVACAVCGPEGELIAFVRIDGLNPTSSVIAQNKAYTAAREQNETIEIGKRMKTGNIFPQFWGDDRITGFGGGVPI